MQHVVDYGAPHVFVCKGHIPFSHYDMLVDECVSRRQFRTHTQIVDDTTTAKPPSKGTPLRSMKLIIFQND